MGCENLDSPRKITSAYPTTIIDCAVVQCPAFAIYHSGKLTNERGPCIRGNSLEEKSVEYPQMHEGSGRS